MDTPAQCRRLWIDVTMLLGWRGNATGIPRTLSELLRHWLTDATVPIGLCRYDSVLRCYQPVMPETLIGPGKPSRPRSSTVESKTRPPSASRLPDDLREAGWHSRHFARHVGRFSRSALRRAWARVLHSLAIFRPVPDPPFALGDVLLLLGDTWQDVSVFDSLAALRRERGLQVVHFIHDITPLRCPQWCIPELTSAYASWLPRVLAVSDLLLSNSEHTRRDLLSHADQHGLSVPPVEPVRLGDEPGTQGGESIPEGMSAFQTRPFALCVGTIALHKNQTLLLHVWRRLLERHGDNVAPLVLVGQPGWRAAEILRDLHADPLLSRHVVHLPRVNDPQLRWLYGHCLFTLYPSHYEGWGLPVAESLVHGKHCICSNATSLPEVGGSLADYHDPLDAPACQALIERALFDKGWLSGREARIRQEYRITSWKDSADQILQILDGNLGPRSGLSAREAA